MKVRYRLDKQGRLHVYHTPARKSGEPAVSVVSDSEHETILDAAEVGRQMTNALLKEMARRKGGSSKQEVEK